MARLPHVHRAVLLATAFVVVACGVGSAIVAHRWNTDYGTWNPLVVRDIKAYMPQTTSGDVASVDRRETAGLTGLEAARAVRDNKIQALKADLAGG